MKTIKKLGALAALVALSSSALQAVTVDLTTVSYFGSGGSTSPAPSPYTDSAGNNYYGYYLTGSGSTVPNSPANTWIGTNLFSSVGIGLGVFSSGFGVPNMIEDLPNSVNSGVTTTYNEYLWIDFGSNYLNKSDLKLNFYSFFGGTVTYYWSNTTLPVSGVSQTPNAATVDAGGTVSIGSALSTLQAVGSGTLSGRYLTLGATSPTMFALAGVQYNQVPDGGLTVTLIGAALGSLGLVSFRRRKA